jgi:hypothetical protein
MSVSGTLHGLLLKFVHGLCGADGADCHCERRAHGVAKDMKEATRLWGLAALADNTDAHQLRLRTEPCFTLATISTMPATSLRKRSNIGRASDDDWTAGACASTIPTDRTKHAQINKGHSVDFAVAQSCAVGRKSHVLCHCAR